MAVTATQTTVLQNDVDADGVIDPADIINPVPTTGDTVRTTVVITNASGPDCHRRVLRGERRRPPQRHDAGRQYQRLADRLQRLLQRDRQYAARGRQRDHPDRPAVERRGKRHRQRYRVLRRHVHHLVARRFPERQRRHGAHGHQRRRHGLVLSTSRPPISPAPTPSPTRCATRASTASPATPTTSPAPPP